MYRLRRHLNISASKTLLNIQKRNIAGGFSYPVPKSLEALVNYDLLAAEEPEIIKQIWIEHHKSTQTAMATVVKGTDFNNIKNRAANTSFFAIPVQRETGHFVLLSNYQDKSFLFTYLDDYNRNPSSAQPYLTITAYEELKESKNVVLLRADICAAATLTQQDAKRVMDQIIQFYKDESSYPYVYAFNKNPENFDFNDAFMYANNMPEYNPPNFDTD